jgi:hypothetical protein
MTVFMFDSTHFSIGWGFIPFIFGIAVVFAAIRSER